MTPDEANELIDGIAAELYDHDRISLATAVRCEGGQLQRAWETATDDWAMFHLGAALNWWDAEGTTCGKDHGPKRSGCVNCCAVIRRKRPSVALADVFERARRSA